MPASTRLVVDAVSVPPRKTPRAKIPGVFWFLAFVTLLALGTAGYFYAQYHQLAQTALTPEEEMRQIIGAIDKSIALPQSETPVLATVSDVSRLAGKKFFEKAENGDKVLIYTEAGMAYLYRPSIRKLINISQLNVQGASMDDGTPVSELVTPHDQESEPSTASADQHADDVETMQSEAEAVVPEMRIAMYNGSTKIGVTSTLEDEIKTKFPDVEVVAKEKAAKNDYQGDLIIDLSGKNADFLQSLADSFGGTVGTLPAGETQPEADILIIIGNKQ